MMRIVPENLNFDFLGLRRFALAFSIALLLLTVGLLVTKGLNFGIDFIGGTQVQIKTEKVVDIAELRALLSDNKVEAAIQGFGSDVDFVLRARVQDNDETSALVAQAQTVLAQKAGTVEVRGVEYVGPQVGAELREKGVLAIVISMIAILIYISMRFEIWYGVGAIVALFHDVFLTVGGYSLMQREVSLPVLAALLTVIGYSLNDTIVVFDRVRENRRKYRKKPLLEVLNMSLNEMLNRTLMTSLTTLVVLVSLFYFGGEAIHEFSFTLMFGVIVGTYSSVFVAAPIVLYMEQKWGNKLTGASLKEDEEDLEGFNQ